LTKQIPEIEDVEYDEELYEVNKQEEIKQILNTCKVQDKNP